MYNIDIFYNFNDKNNPTKKCIKFAPYLHKSANWAVLIMVYTIDQSCVLYIYSSLIHLLAKMFCYKNKETY